MQQGPASLALITLLAIAAVTVEALRGISQRSRRHVRCHLRIAPHTEQLTLTCRKLELGC